MHTSEQSPREWQQKSMTLCVISRNSCLKSKQLVSASLTLTLFCSVCKNTFGTHSSSSSSARSIRVLFLFFFIDCVKSSILRSHFSSTAVTSILTRSLQTHTHLSTSTFKRTKVQQTFSQNILLLKNIMLKPAIHVPVATQEIKAFVPRYL